MGNSHQSHRSRSLSADTLNSYTTNQTPPQISVSGMSTQSTKHHYKHSIRVNGKPPSTSFPRLESQHSDSAPNISRSFSKELSTSRDKVLIIQGWLTKRGETSKKLKKRYWKLYDNGILKYNTKPSGSFKKYADLKRGIDNMSLKDENGFAVQVSNRHLIFYAETSKERDAWFAIIYHHYFEKGRENLKLLAQSSGDREHMDKYKEEMKDTFAIPKSPNSNYLDVIHERNKDKDKQNTIKQRKRGNSFDSTKNAQRNGNNKTRSTIRARSAQPKRANGHSNGSKAKEDERVIFSEQYMNQECDGKTCLSLERVKYVLKKYDLWRNRNKLRSIKGLGMYKYINNGLGEYYNNTHLLNDYNHLIQFHDDVFHHIYAYFDGECDFGRCVLIKRLHRDRDYYRDDEKRKEIYYNYDDEKEINTQQILNKIHCYYRHAYDLGFRVKQSKLLRIQKNVRKRSRWSTADRASAVMQSIKKLHKTKSYTIDSKEAQNIIFNHDALSEEEEEKEEMNTIEEEEEEEARGFEDEWALLDLCGLIQQKRNNLRMLRGTKRMNMNKFIGKVGTSQRYHYWMKYDDDDDKHWQIEIKYETFKDEMLSNQVYTISVQQWQYLHEKAHDHYHMKRSRKIRPNKYWAELYELPNDAANSSSFSITMSHIIAIMLHSNFDSVQREFTETFYRLEDESDEALKCRHSNFFHFGRLLRELIECFGKKKYNKNIVFYHGITDDLMFIESTKYFYAPLSVTTSIEVAIAYSNNNGKDYLLELVDDDSVLGMARYFDCSWLSDFGNECEKYFVGGYKPLKIHTVLDAVLGRNYINYLKALYMIDRMMAGYYFDNESEEIKQIIVHLLQIQIARHAPRDCDTPKPVNRELLNEVKQLNHKSFDEEDEAAIESHRRKMSRRISETFPMARGSSNPFTMPTEMEMDDEEFDYFNQVPKYITKLIDFYCCNLTNVCVDWSNLNASEGEWIKKLLCHDKYEWIKLNIFLSLFPQLKQLNVRNIKLCKQTIKDICWFLLNAKREEKYLDLHRIEIFEVNQDEYAIAQCLQEYADKLKQIGWSITVNPFEDEMCIVRS
eukprot:148770_1